MTSMSTSLLLIAVLTSTTTANPLSHQKRTSHLSKRLVYYGPSILGTLLAIGFVVFWLGLCIWYIRYRRRIGRPAASVETIFARRFFPWMWQPESQVIVPQPTVVVVNNNNGPPPHPQQGMYGYGPVNGQEAYSQQMYGQGPYGVYQGGGGAPWHGSGGGNPGRDGRVRPASPAPAYMGK